MERNKTNTIGRKIASDVVPTPTLEQVNERTKSLVPTLDCPWRPSYWRMDRKRRPWVYWDRQREELKNHFWLSQDQEPAWWEESIDCVNLKISLPLDESIAGVSERTAQQQQQELSYSSQRQQAPSPHPSIAFKTKGSLKQRESKSGSS